MPTSMAWPSFAEGFAGTAFAGKSVHGQARGLTVTPTLDDGLSRLPLSSTARLRIVVAPETPGVHEYVQLAAPVALCQVVPPSVETSTPATTPPVSLAVPETVTAVPLA